MNTADRIQHLRKMKGISQEELADMIGVSRQAVSKWESEQSLPDIDKIIIMSDLFEVTTDYILKGIEVKKQTSEKTVNMFIFVIVATVFNFIGLIMSVAVWYEEQAPMAIIIGLIFMSIGCMVFGIGLVTSTQNKASAKRYFWTINIWILSFTVFSGIYNLVFTRSIAPYPLYFKFQHNIVTYSSFWLVYVASCLLVVISTIIKERRK